MTILISLSLCFGVDLATVSGFVKFPGETPLPFMFANASDHECPHGIPQDHLVVKQETLGLKNALVILEPRERRVMPTRIQSTLTSDGCRLFPRIQWVPLGTSVLFVNKDGAHHHYRALQRKSTVFEADLPGDSLPVRRPAVIPGLYKIQCDWHPWERAWIYVSPHDSVAITDVQGQFSMKNVPPGRYLLRVWHEGWVERGKDREGRLELAPMGQIQEIKVRADTPNLFQFTQLKPIE
jgi:hypothetical protein